MLIIKIIVIVWHDLKTEPFRLLYKSIARHRKHGLHGVLERIEKDYRKLNLTEGKLNGKSTEYKKWIEKNEKNIHNISFLQYKPLISIITPTYNTHKQYLKEMLDSVLYQTYTNWELCIADDASSDQHVKQLLLSYAEKYKNIKLTFRTQNGHISEASNSAVQSATGEYLAFLDHDDTLAPNALYEMVKKINENRSLKILYSDEDKIDKNSVRFNPHFKSGWNRDMFYSYNYICHFLFLKKELVDKTKGFRKGYEGSQDYDLLLQCLHFVNDFEINNIEKILYHWRAVEGSTAYGTSEKPYAHNAGRKALKDYFACKDKSILVEDGLLPNTYKITYPLYETPLVSILVPTRDRYDILSKCIESILSKTDYINYEIIILDNNTTCSKTLTYFHSLQSYKQISIIKYPHPFNYSAINNFGVSHANGTIIALINNDVEIISQHWLTEMVQHALRPEIGAVGAKLYYENNTVQHAGVVTGLGGVAGHVHKYFKKEANGYYSRLKIIQNYSAITAACLVIRKALYLEVNGLNADNLSIAFNDVDFCLKIQQNGYRNLWTPYVELYHHESVSRGSDTKEEHQARFLDEVKYMQSTWGENLNNDMYYNSNLTMAHMNFQLNVNDSNMSFYNHNALLNFQNFKVLQKKYKIKKYTKYIDNFYIKMNKNNKSAILKKFKRIPHRFIRNFNQQDYIKCNVDVEASIENAQIMNAFEHFILHGYDEVRLGKRRIGSIFPLFSEADYTQDNPDIVREVAEGKFSTTFDHFLRFGYIEFINGTRKISGHYPFQWDAKLLTHVKSYFKEEDYLTVNPDVKIAISENKFTSAWNHFMLRGTEEIRKGDRSLHPLLPKQSEEQYANEQHDISDSQKYPLSKSPFEHYLYYGAQEIIHGTRTVMKGGIYRFIQPKMTVEIQNELSNQKTFPLLSIIMPVYNVDAQWLKLAIDSVLNQWYPCWELCIVDDASLNKDTINFLNSLSHPQIKIIFSQENSNISATSNIALSLAEGEYIVLMDHDDELSPNALYEIYKSIQETNAEFIYSDEDKLDENNVHCDPHFKPNYAPDTLFSQNYISHLCAIKKNLVDTVGGWSVGLEGSQDYDLYLKVLEHTNKISHIPKVLYHWRKLAGSTAAEFSHKSYAQATGKKAIEHALKRRSTSAKVNNGKHPGTYQIKYEIKDNPLVSIIIPFKDKPQLLDTCINSILTKSSYQNYEIIGISNNSVQQETFDLMQILEKEDSRVSFYEYNIDFNYSAINNYAVNTYAHGHHVLLLNNDIEVISEDWIESMLSFSQRNDVGAVGAKLYYPNDTIQHAGVTIGVHTLAGHNFKHLARDAVGYMGRESIIQNVSAVTAACLMIKRDLYLEMKGMDESNLKIAFNDIDFCLRLREKNYLNIITPYAELYHYESITRGYEDNSNKLKRFHREIYYMQERHNSILRIGDPYYNPNLTLNSEDFSVK